MTREEIEDAITNLDDRHLSNAIHHKPIKKRKFGRKFLTVIAAVIVLNSFLGFSTGYKLRTFIGKNWAEISGGLNSDGNYFASGSVRYDLETSPPYRVKNGEIYFIYDGLDKNITEFCSEYDCFVYTNVNFWGNGYYIAVGGTPDNVGFQFGTVFGEEVSSTITIFHTDIERDSTISSEFIMYTEEHYWCGALDYEIFTHSLLYQKKFSTEQQLEFDKTEKPTFDYCITKG